MLVHSYVFFRLLLFRLDLLFEFHISIGRAEARRLGTDGRLRSGPSPSQLKIKIRKETPESGPKMIRNDLIQKLCENNLKLSENDPEKVPIPKAIANSSNRHPKFGGREVFDGRSGKTSNQIVRRLKCFVRWAFSDRFRLCSDLFWLILHGFHTVFFSFLTSSSQRRFRRRCHRCRRRCRRIRCRRRLRRRRRLVVFMDRPSDVPLHRYCNCMS